MRKLSKKIRLERAIKEAEERGKTGELKGVDDWIFSIAFHWGFEEDIPAQKIISEAFLRAFDES